jgi:hypothetical protein
MMNTTTIILNMWSEYLTIGMMTLSEQGEVVVKPNLECPHCGFIWTPKVENPRACPRCKRYFDYKVLPPIPTDKEVHRKRRISLPETKPLEEFERLSVLCERHQNIDASSSVYAEVKYNEQNLCLDCLREVIQSERA